MVIAGDPNQPHGTHIILSREDGALLVSEAGLTGGTETASWKIGIGAWDYTSKGMI